jgi:hypothetical protein
MRRNLVLFTIAFVVAFLAIVSFHGIPTADLQSLGRMVSGRGQAVFFANSIGRAKSECDSDGRSIVQFATLDSREKIIDSAVGGMPLNVAMQSARIGMTLKRVDALIFLVSAYDGYFNAAQLPYGLGSWIEDNLGFIVGRSPVSEENRTPLVFEGHRFGVYDELARTYFAREKAARTCPEKPGVDQLFLRFMYWRNLAHTPVDGKGLQAFERFVDDAKRSGVRVMVVFTPVNVELARKVMTPQSLAVMYANMKNIRADIRKANIRYVDLQEALPQSAFADQWCACGHMNQSGRAVVGRAIANMLNAKDGPYGVVLPPYWGAKSD